MYSSSYDESSESGSESIDSRNRSYSRESVDSRDKYSRRDGGGYRPVVVPKPSSHALLFKSSSESESSERSYVDLKQTVKKVQKPEKEEGEITDSSEVCIYF